MTIPHGYRRAASRLDSFRHAFAGLGYILRTQANAWIHVGVAMGVVCVGLWLKLNWIEWAVLVLTFGLVWMAEAINTALEAIVDLYSPAYHPLAKVGKDVAAAAVLAGAFVAVIVGLLVLGPPLWTRIGLLWP